MRNILNIMVWILASVMILACSGNVDDTSLPVLSVDDSEIDLASETRAVFTVTYNGQDVTQESVIFSTLSSLELQDNVFVPENEGEDIFVASYDGMQSEPVKVTVVNSSPAAIDSKFDRHVCVVEFTGASCAFCPDGYDNMKAIMALPALADYKERMHVCAFHSEEMGTDTLAINETYHVQSLFGALGLPSYSVDLRDCGGLSDDGKATLRPSLMRSFNDYPAHCGVAVSSAVNGSQFEVNVKVSSERNTIYRVVLLVVQDKIVGYQKHGTYGELDDYSHRHVVRKVITSYVGTFTGEKLTEDGRISAGQEAAGTWTVDLDNRWVLENTEIYALVLDENGYVNNMNVCAIDGGDSGYDYK